MTEIKSNVTGTVIELLCKVGDRVEKDQDVISVESMKMEMTVQSESAGEVAEIKVAQDDFIQEGDVLLVLK